MATLSIVNGEIAAVTVTINSPSSYAEAARIRTNGRRVALRLTAGAAGAITDVQISGSPLRDGTAVARGANTGLNSTTVLFPWCMPACGASGSAIPAGSSIDVCVDSVDQDLVISAKGTTTTLTISGSAA